MTPTQAEILDAVADVGGISVRKLLAKGTGAGPEISRVRAAAALLLRRTGLSYESVARLLRRTGGGVLRLLRTHTAPASADDLQRIVDLADARLIAGSSAGTSPYSWGLGSRWIRTRGGPKYSSVEIVVDSTGLWSCTLTCADPANELGGLGPWIATASHPLVALTHAYRMAMSARREG